MDGLSCQWQYRKCNIEKRAMHKVCRSEDAVRLQFMEAQPARPARQMGCVPLAGAVQSAGEGRGRQGSGHRGAPGGWAQQLIPVCQPGPPGRPGQGLPEDARRGAAARAHAAVHAMTLTQQALPPVHTLRCKPAHVCMTLTHRRLYCHTCTFCSVAAAGVHTFLHEPQKDIMLQVLAPW